MQNNSIDFTIENAGCLIWLAPSSLGGLSPEQFGHVWVGSADETVHDLVARGAIIPMSLYQDDGFNVRFTVGDLNDQAEAEWTARVRWRLSVPCGKVIVSGSLSEDFDDEFSAIEDAVDGGSYWVGCFVDVPPGEYQVEVYSYPPHDLSSGWGHITYTELFGEVPGIEPEEALDYFRRTRPNDDPPRWVKGDYEETSYINFIVRLQPKVAELSTPKLEGDGCIEWEFRKPEICPLGIRDKFSQTT